MGYALRRSLSVVAGCLGNGRLRQQWACISVGAGCLGNGGRPSPTEHLRDRLYGERLESLFFLSHCPTPNAVFLQSPGLAHCPGLLQSQVQHSQVSGCWFNRAPGQARPVGSAGLGRPPPPRLLASPGRSSAWCPVSPLYLGISSFCGQQDQSENAALTHLSADSLNASILGCSHSTILSPLPNLNI